MSGYKVECKSRKDLREYAYQIRKNIGLENALHFPIAHFLELLPEIFPCFHYEIVEDREFSQNVHADIDIISQCVRIKQSVYDGACAGNGCNRMTIAHEIGHYLTLCVSGFKLARNFGSGKLRAYEDPEWQAKRFAGELLVGAHLVRGMTVHEISEKCGVSLKAAEYQLKKERGDAYCLQK